MNRRITELKSEKALTDEQNEAIKHGNGPLLIIAGAGTGKTTVITERIKYLILEKGIMPSEILALTFTEKAALEMEERVDKVMPYGYTQMWISTFHSFCDRILRQEAIHIGLNPSYKIMTEPESILFLRKNIFSFNLSYFRPLGNPNKFLEGMIAHFSRLKDEDISPSQYLQYAKGISNQEEKEKTLELAKAYKLYEELKTKDGVFDFSDLIGNTLKLFRERKNILKTYREQFKYILIDEFQDTNYAQNELAIQLCGDRQNITVVGDDDQAIYRWRGAAVSNIIQFKKHFPKTKIVVLSKNFRSTEEILNSSYRLIQNNNPDRLEVKEKINKKLISMRRIKGDPITLTFADRVENEADTVAKKIKEIVNQKKYEFKDFAILVRANNHSEPFIRAFERYRIPYQFLGPGQLFRQEEIKDLIAYLKVLYNFEDNLSLYRVLSIEYLRLAPRDIAAIINFARKQNISLFEAMELIDNLYIDPKTKEKIKEIVNMINRHLKLMRTETAGQIIYYFLKDTGILNTFTSYETPLDEKKAKNIARFFDKLKTYEVEHQDASVPTIVEWIDLSIEMRESPQAANIDWTDVNAVNILTIHSSKGLEFPIVFLVNLVLGRFPTRERSEQIPIPDALIKEILPEGDYHLQEERRLFYVGLTRAKDNVFLTASNYYGEGKRERKLSPFVYETLGEVPKIAPFESQTSQLTLLQWNGPNDKEENQVIIKNNQTIPVDYLSFSQIETFNTCPMHYKAKYILRIPVPQTPAQSFGTSIHATLRDFHQLLAHKGLPKKDDLLKLFEKNWIEEGYDSRQHRDRYFEEGKKILTSYLQAFDPKIRSLYLEFPFQFRILKDKKILKIAGKIDRVDKLQNGKIEIIDYKTGKQPKENNIDENLQLTVYALAATELKDPNLNKDPSEISLSLYYLESGRKLTTTRSAKQLESAKSELWDIADKISVSDFTCLGGSFCKMCEFKMLCSVKD